MIVMGLTTNIWLLMAVAFMWYRHGSIHDSWQTALQTHIPRAFLSRVASYDAFGPLAPAPLGLVLVGPAVELIRG